jgi:hypothetical protein
LSDDDFGTADLPLSRLEANFWHFHAENPHVYRLFDRFTSYAIERGRARFSVSIIFERIRWETHIETGDPDFKLNNNHRAYYARLWMRDHPEHAGFFEVRRTREPTSEALKRRAEEEKQEAVREGAIAFAGEAVFAYLDTLPDGDGHAGLYDVSKLTPEEWLQFLKIIVETFDEVVEEGHGSDTV